MRTLSEHVKFLDEEKLSARVAAYAKKNGGVDKDDILAVADAIEGGMESKELHKLLKLMDKSPREAILSIVNKDRKIK
jgi:hypothetical protein